MLDAKKKLEISELHSILGKFFRPIPNWFFAIKIIDKRHPTEFFSFVIIIHSSSIDSVKRIETSIVWQKFCIAIAEVPFSNHMGRIGALPFRPLVELFDFLGQQSFIQVQSDFTCLCSTFSINRDRKFN